MLELVDFEVDWRLLAARDPGADLLDVVPLPAAPVDLLDHASDLPVEVLDADDVLDVVVSAERRIAAAQAMQIRALARFAKLRPSGDPDNVMSEFAADEVAPALRLTRNSAMVRLDLATALTTRLPATLSALERGEIDLIKARAVVELPIRSATTTLRRYKIRFSAGPGHRLPVNCGPACAVPSCALTPRAPRSGTSSVARTGGLS